MSLLVSSLEQMGAWGKLRLLLRFDRPVELLQGKTHDADKNAGGSDAAEEGRAIVENRNLKAEVFE